MSSKNKKKWNCMITSNGKSNCGCTKPKLSEIIDPKPKQKQKQKPEHISTNLPAKIVGSVAIVKDSNDPYEDFRRSMIQMIMEKEIYKYDDLNELLNCFLELNSPSHHDVIVKAFMEIWDNGKIVNKEGGGGGGGGSLVD
ncbi:transcription repressor OFP6 [Capsicum chacoense]